MEIENLMFFDVGATGLFEEDTQENPVKIATLSMTSIKTSDFLQSNGELGRLPRVSVKLTLNFNPVSKFTEKATKINGLTNDMLSTHRPFSTLANKQIKVFFDIRELESDSDLLRRELNDPTVTRNISCFNTFEFSHLAFKCSAKSLETTYEEKFGTRPKELNREEANVINLIKIARMTPSDFVEAMQSFKRPLNEM